MTHGTRRFDGVICDIDGCLGSESSDPLDLESLAIIATHNRRAQRDADVPELTVCSGRPQPFAEAMARLVGVRDLPAIAEHGVWLWWAKDNRYERDPAITPEHLRAVDEARAWLEETFGPKGVVQQPGKSCSISLYHPDTTYLTTVAEVVRASFEMRGWPLRVSMTWLWINCDLKHISKASAIDRMASTLGLERPRLAGIGDTIGDLAIRERVGWFACPANASDEIKAHADYVASRSEAAGVVEILERIVGS